MRFPEASGARARFIIGLALLAFAASACGGGDDGASQDAEATTTLAESTVDPADCSAQVDNSYVPLASVKVKVFRGEEPGEEGGELVETRALQRVQPKPVTIGGFPVRVVEVTERENGELVEHTLDYYSQCGDGVWYVGEKVDNYEDGRIVDHEGQWLAGENGASAGLFMPADPKVGDSFQQERAPGVAEDQSTVVATDVQVTSPAGKFSGCIRTKDFAPLDKITEFKLYCPDVGLVREELTEGRVELLRYS